VSDTLLVMRPYQIAATERILWKINSSFLAKTWSKPESGGYVWHTTGSGKTLTSFKAARLATELEFVDKVFFVVDRKDLDYQTMKEYQRFSPDSVNGSDSTAGLNRAKESLVVDFINQANLDQIPDKASVIEAFFNFARSEQKREAGDLISDENLNTEAAKRYISNSLKREYASDNGTELNSMLPKMSPLNPQYLTKKQSVFQKIAAFVEKFNGVGGEV
jgi:type I site-specific restriction-modification system R (restriction) subunit